MTTLRDACTYMLTLKGGRAARILEARRSLLIEAPDEAAAAIRTAAYLY
jgi:hypothetical protein